MRGVKRRGEEGTTVGTDGNGEKGPMQKGMTKNLLNMFNLQKKFFEQTQVLKRVFHNLEAIRSTHILKWV